MKFPYIGRLDSRGDIQVWLVNGSYIRSHIDEEFTNFGQHYRYSYIPWNEFWIDVGNRDEIPFFIDHLLVEHRLMSKGMSYDKALKAADRVERRERKATASIYTTTDLTKFDRHSLHEVLWKMLSNGLQVWIVNGKGVRDNLDTDFTEGGNDMVYDFIPAYEIWIDDTIPTRERKFTVLHELHERSIMAAGAHYPTAHASASRLEASCRHHPENLEPILKAEGWSTL